MQAEQTTPAPITPAVRQALTDAARRYVAAYDRKWDAWRRSAAGEFDAWHGRRQAEHDASGAPWTEEWAHGEHPDFEAGVAGFPEAHDTLYDLMEAAGLTTLAVDGRTIVLVESDEHRPVACAMEDAGLYVTAGAPLTL
jgi:hypothetical protein